MDIIAYGEARKARARAELLSKAGAPWWDSAFAAPIADDTPTVAVATSGAISGGTSVYPTTDYFGDTHFRYDDCASVSSPGANLVAAVQPASGGTAYYTLVPEFVTSQGCDKVDIKFTMNAAGTYMGLRVIINGRWLTLPMQWYATAINTVYWVRLTFPTAKARSIRVETANTGNFGGVVVPSGETVTRPGGEIRKRMVILGDSYTVGANAHTTSDPTTNGCARFETFPYYVAKLLGCDSVLNLGVGGTGWVNDASTKTTFGARVADILAANPHIVLAAGSRNDNPYTGAQVYAAAASALAQLVDIPVVEVCALGDAGSGSGTTGSVLNEAVKQAARLAGRHFNDVLGVVGSDDKNSADNVHPSILGAQKLAKAFYTTIDRAHIDPVVAGAVGGRLSSDVTLTASPSSAAHTGMTVTLTATLSTHRAGTVAFYNGTTLLGTGTVTAGVATWSSSSLAIASYALTARFIPTNPLLVKSVLSNPLAYVVDANLGFEDHFAIDGTLTTTENGKSYVGGGGSGTAAASGGTATITWSSGTKFFVVDAGTPNGTYSVKLSGTMTSIVLPLRYVDGTNQLRLALNGGQIKLYRTVSGTSTVIGTGTIGAWASGDVVSVEFSGDSITVKLNGTTVSGIGTVTESTYNTATKFGIGANAAGATFDDLTFVAA